MNAVAMGFENIVDAHGISLSIVGMLIVLLALAIIAICITLVSKVLPLFEKLLPERQSHSSPATGHGQSHGQGADHDEMLAAIAYALFRKETGSLPTK